MTCAASAAYTPGSAGRGGTVSGTTGTGSAGSSSLPPGSSGGGGASVVVVVLVVVVGLVVGAGNTVSGGADDVVVAEVAPGSCATAGASEPVAPVRRADARAHRSEEHTSELQSLM